MNFRSAVITCDRSRRLRASASEKPRSAKTSPLVIVVAFMAVFSSFRFPHLKQGDIALLTPVEIGLRCRASLFHEAMEHVDCLLEPRNVEHSILIVAVKP